MTIFLINSKPYISVSNGFQPLSEYLYQELIERGEIDHTEVIEHD